MQTISERGIEQEQAWQVAAVVWEGLSQSERNHLMVKIGFVTKTGKLSAKGKRAVGSSWPGLVFTTKRLVRDQIISEYTKG